MGIVPPPSGLPRGAYGGGGFYQQQQPNRKVLAAGVAGSPVATIYTVPLRTQTEILSIHVHNHDGAAATLDFFIRVHGGTSYHWRREALGANTSNDCSQTLAGMHICLGPGWEIRALASKAASLDYLITGIEWFLPTGGATD